MENIPMRVSIEEDRTFDHDESDYLLSPPSEASGVRFKKKKTTKFSMERYVIWISSCTICIILCTRPMLLSRFCANLYQCCRRQKELKSRTVWIGLSHEQQREKSDDYFPPNGIRNQKYNFFSFLPLVSTFFFNHPTLNWFQNWNSHISITGIVPAIQIFPQPLLPYHGC